MHRRISLRALWPALAAVLFVACAHVPIPPPEPLSPEAAAFFARAESEDNAGSVVLDVDALRALGFLRPAPPGHHSIWSDLIAYTLPTVAGEFRNQPEGPLIARSAVLFALFREWDGWPRVQRAGVILPHMDDPDAAADRLISLIAVEGGPEKAQTLLSALAAADRAGGTPDLTSVDGSLCLPPDRQNTRWCVRAGPGYLVVGTPQGLADLPQLLKPMPAKPVRPAILRARLNLPSLGKGFLVLEPNDGVRLRAAFAAKGLDVAQLVEQRALDVLGQLEARHEAQQALIAPVLTQTQIGLMKDPQAPASLKAVAQRLSVEGLLDPEGTWAAIRKSIKVERQENLVTAELVIPEAAVRRTAEGGSSFATFAIVGLLSSIAIPAVVKYQCETKQAEATATLATAAATARETFEAGKPVTNFASFGFQAPENARYTYCLGEECIPCHAEGCYTPPPEANPCLRLAKSDMAHQKYRFLMCAIADLDNQPGEGDLDVWVVTDDGVPKHLQNDCK
jgi:hypothetical protein